MRANTLREMGREIGRLAGYVVRRYQADGASAMAGNLGYTSLLALVPLIAIGLAMLAAFPVFDPVRGQLQDFAFRTFAPEMGEVVKGYIDTFVANAGRLSAAGIVGLAVTSVMLLVTIEGVLNRVFRVARDRSPASRLLVYWTVLTLGPLLMGATFTLQGYLTALGRWAGAADIPGVSRLLAPLPTLFSALAFTVLYAAVPNRRVLPKDAALGGILAGLLFAGLRWGFGLYVIHSQAYSTVYGAVAAVPIFLLWMFLSWAVVLAGAEFTAALPEWRAGACDEGRQVPSSRRLALALQILDGLRRASAGGETGVSRRVLLADSGAGERAFLAVLHRLAAAGLVAPTSGRRWLLARALSDVTLAEVLKAVGIELALDEAVGRAAPWREAAGQRLAAAARAAGRELEVPLASVLK